VVKHNDDVIIETKKLGNSDLRTTVRNATEKVKNDTDSDNSISTSLLFLNTPGSPLKQTVISDNVEYLDHSLSRQFSFEMQRSLEILVPRTTTNQINKENILNTGNGFRSDDQSSTSSSKIGPRTKISSILSSQINEGKPTPAVSPPVSSKRTKGSENKMKKGDCLNFSSNHKFVSEDFASNSKRAGLQMSKSQVHFKDTTNDKLAKVLSSLIPNSWGSNLSPSTTLEESIIDTLPLDDSQTSLGIDQLNTPQSELKELCVPIDRNGHRLSSSRRLSRSLAEIRQNGPPRFISPSASPLQSRSLSASTGIDHEEETERKNQETSLILTEFFGDRLDLFEKLGFSTKCRDPDIVGADLKKDQEFSLRRYADLCSSSSDDDNSSVTSC